jgi:hypothetical protein
MSWVERSPRRLLNDVALMPAGCTFGDSFLAIGPSGLAVSEEAVSPLLLERVATGVCQSERVD